jgi:hypothetical protein
VPPAPVLLGVELWQQRYASAFTRAASSRRATISEKG